MIYLYIKAITSFIKLKKKKAIFFSSGGLELICNELNYVYATWGAHVYIQSLELVVKNLPTNAGDLRIVDLIPGSGRSPGGHGSPLQYSCLENLMDRAAWRAEVHVVKKCRT